MTALWRLSPHVDLRSGRVDDADAQRQLRTAGEICRRLDDQPGIVLADEVGMGKTFVAFAVAVSVLHATNRRRPVVVMVPPSVSEKWPRDWSVFETHCLRGGPKIRVSTTTVRRGSEFLKLLDDPAATRTHIIFLTHGALTVSLNDPFVRLAIVRQAFLHQRSLASQRKVFPRWAARLLGDRKFTPSRTQRLLDAPPGRWRDEWERAGGGLLTDDPVPAAAVRAMAHAKLGSLRERLALLPLRQSPGLDGRLRTARKELSRSVDQVWLESLHGLEERLPLLILDEAHHAKNANSLARLFATAEAQRDAEALTGPLSDVFDRMLFLTATPFQLGHRELLSVLSRFTGARVPPSAKVRLRTDLDALGETLDAAQAASLRLERAWARLRTEDLDGLPARWWDPTPPDAPETVRIVASEIEEARHRLRNAEAALQPWVIRHTKEKRRDYLAGQRILDANNATVGIDVTGPAVLPFLLAARAHALVALHGLQEHHATRAYFADGLASSFEAFADTRAHHQGAVDDLSLSVDGDVPAAVRWYLDQIAASLPDAEAESWAQHPKVAATVRRAAQLWCDGEKVLVFCFYRATGRALRSHISRALQDEIVQRGAQALGLDSADADAVLQHLDQRANSLLRSDAAGARVVADRVRRLCAQVGVVDADAGHVVDVTVRFMRTGSFLVRFVDLGARRSDTAINAAFEKPDASGVSLTSKIAGFADLVAGLTDVERVGLWEALTRIQTGTISTVTSDFYDPGETSLRREATLPNVRLANGTVRLETRHRLMRTFNTPFFPEVLVASAVMAEGVDLHLDCRHVIHHDLDWNPSTLEQRTGRLDRMGSKAERHRARIVVYEPYMAGTQDEKMYRVVKDRERWFNVMMGEGFDESEWATDKLAERMPLPEGLARDLAVDLSIPDR